MKITNYIEIFHLINRIGILCIRALYSISTVAQVIFITFNNNLDRFNHKYQLSKCENKGG